VRFRPLLPFALTLLSSFAAAVAHAEEPVSPAAAPAAPPAADLPPPSARANLILAGAATTVVSYGLAFGASYLYSEQDFRGSNDLRIPVAGPWMALGRTGCPTSDPGCSKPLLAVGVVLSIFDGVAQLGGLAVIGEGLFLNTSSGPRRKAATGPTVRAVPLNFEKGGVGLGVVGTF
jgi:hypothetical protein